MKDNEYDAATEDAVREALASAAHYRPATEDDWRAFVDSRRAGAGGHGSGGHGSDGRGSGDTVHRWRVPLIVAAAVAAVAIGITAVTTHGFGFARHHAATDGAPPPGTGVSLSSQGPGPTSSSATEPGAGVSAPIGALRPLDDVARCVDGADQPNTDGAGLSGLGFDGNDVMVAVRGEGMCFFDGRSWWAADADDAPLRIAHITDVGIGPEHALDAPQDRRTRFVFGMVGTDVTAVIATVNGGIYTPLVGPAFRSDVQVFVIAVPAAGAVELNATDADGKVLGSVTLGSLDDGQGSDGGTGPYVATYPDPDAGMDALLTGTVQVLNGCLAVVAGSGLETSVTVPVFPASHTETATSPAVLRFQDVDYRVGDEISLGGGFVGGADDGLGIPVRCSASVYAVSPFA